MTGRRSYRSGSTGNSNTGGSGYGGGAPRRSAPQGDGQQGDGEFTIITGLFRSKSGKADTVFVTDDIAAKLAQVKPGDTLGVSMSTKADRLTLWFINKEGN